MQIRAVRTEGVYQTGSFKVSNILVVYITSWLFPFQYAVESELVPLRKGKKALFITGYFEFFCRKFSAESCPGYPCPRAPSPAPVLLLPLVCHSLSQVCIKWMSAMIPSWSRLTTATGILRKKKKKEEKKLKGYFSFRYFKKGQNHHSFQGAFSFSSFTWHRASCFVWPAAHHEWHG